MKKREKSLLIWHHHHVISVTLFICINVLAIGGVGRRNSDLPFNTLRNGGLMLGVGAGAADDRRMRLGHAHDESSSRNANFFLNYYNYNLSRSTGLALPPSGTNSNGNSNSVSSRTRNIGNGQGRGQGRGQVLRLRDNNHNDDSNENLISRRMNFINNSNNDRIRNSDDSNVNVAPAPKKNYVSRQGSASINSILRLDPSKSLWDASSIVCHSVPGLTKEQMELCLRTPDTTSIALEGLQMATEECAYQMRTHRWNCSSLQGTVNPHSTQLLQKGYRESAFGHSIAAAGVAYAVAKACSQGKLLNCGCGFQYDDQINYVPTKSTDYAFDESSDAVLKKNGATSWKWAGCSHNMNYGMKFAKLFLDSREKATDLPSRTNLHNNRVGRLAVAENMEIRCKCHGLSGSCELRTCWRSAPSFRKVGTELKNKFRRAIMIDRSNLGNRPMSRLEYNHETLNKLNKQEQEQQQQQQRRKRDRGRGGFAKKLDKRSSRYYGKNNIDLWYYEKSPTYCESNADFNFPGTSGRRCNRTSSVFPFTSSVSTAGKDAGSCNTLCCGRGYNTIRQVYTTRCNCQFLWCCQVTCQNCTVDEWITVCK